MSITQTNTIAKIAAVVAGLGLVAMSFASFAVPAKADTTSLQAQIAALQAQLAALMAQAGGSTGASTTFNTNLTVGSKGADVTALQNWLIGKGFAISAGATGYFGAQTKAALAAYQAANGITPAAGYFGPITRAKVNAAGGTGGTTSTTGLTGTGRLTAESQAGDVTTTLYEGDSATAVIGDQFTATDGDVALQRVDATFDLSAITGGTNPSTNLDQYVSDVSLYLGSTKLATMKASDGDKSSNVWTFRFSGLNAVIKQGTDAHLYIKVTPVTSVGSGESGAVLTAKLLANAVRAVGADGISDTYVASNLSQTFSVSTATTGTLTVTAAGDNPVASQVAVSSSTTSGVTLLSFNMKAKNSDIKVTNLKAQFNTTDNNLSDVVNTVYLMKGSTVLKSATLSTGSNGGVTFTNVNQTISKDSTANYTIVADLKGDSAYADNTTLVASTTVAGWDVSDSSGSSVTPSAAAAGNTQTLTATGITVAKGTPSVSVTTGLASAGDVGAYSIPFTVTAGDSDVFISGTTGYSGATTAIVYATTSTSGQAKTNQGTANFTAATTVTGDSAGAYYKVLAGTSRTFTLTVAYTATSTGFTGLQLSSIAYGATSSLGSTYSSNLDSFKTDNVNLVMH